MWERSGEKALDHESRWMSIEGWLSVRASEHLMALDFYIKIGIFESAYTHVEFLMIFEIPRHQALKTILLPFLQKLVIALESVSSRRRGN